MASQCPSISKIRPPNSARCVTKSGKLSQEFVTRELVRGWWVPKGNSGLVVDPLRPVYHLVSRSWHKSHLPDMTDSQKVESMAWEKKGSIELCNSRVAGMTMDLLLALWVSEAGGVAGSKRLGVTGHGCGVCVCCWAQLWGSRLNIAGANRLINVVRVNPAGTDQSLDTFWPDSISMDLISSRRAVWTSHFFFYTTIRFSSDH